jgi:hypothetical protein
MSQTRKTVAIAMTAMVAALSSCHKNDVLPTKAAATVNPVTPSKTFSVNATLTLGAPIAEAKFYKLFTGYDSGDDFEASGVKVVGNYFYAVFDNRLKIGKVLNSLPINSNSNSLVSSGSGNSNFEGITYDNYSTPNFYVVDENESHNGAYSPKIYEYDASMNLQSTAWAPYSFSAANSNKGFEGLVWVRRNNTDYLLGLCEGTGVIVVMQQDGNNWDLVTTFNMPTGTGMTDFSDIDISASGRVGVTSQESSKLWIGQLSTTSWGFTDGGVVYNFPTGDANGNVGAGSDVLYGNVEGVSFITDTKVVCTSDKAKSSQPSYQTIKDQSIHIFNLPQ